MEAADLGRRDAAPPRIGDLLLCQISRQTIARRLHERPFRVAEHRQDRQAHPAELFEMLSRIWRVPSEVPDGGALRGIEGRRVDLTEQHVDVAPLGREPGRGAEPIEPPEACPFDARKGPLVVLDGALGVHRVQVQVVEVGRGS